MKKKGIHLVHKFCYITTCWGTIFEKVEIVKNKPKHLFGSLMWLN